MNTTKVYISPGITQQLPEILENLPDGRYRLTKQGMRAGRERYGFITVGEAFVGDLTIENFNNGGAFLGINWGTFRGMHTSTVVAARRSEDGKSILVETENSLYLLEGPLPPTERL